MCGYVNCSNMKNLWEINRNMHTDAKFQAYDYIDHVQNSGPTCEDLGIPRDDACAINPTLDAIDQSFTGPEVRYSMISKRESDPFSPGCIIPLPSPFGMSIFDSACFRRRNERERDRVRCVNDGYIKLKQHLPIENKEKRLSKVETLRYAINYIKYLNDLLNKSGGNRPSVTASACVNQENENLTRRTQRSRAAIDMLDDEIDVATDSSDYESKYDTSSEVDMSD